MNTGRISIENTEDIEMCIDKLLKFAIHIANELQDNPKHAQFFRGEEYLDIILGFLCDTGCISKQEEETIRKSSIENTIFYTLQKLIENNYLIDSSHEVEDSSYATSQTYAIHIYKILGKILGKEIIDFSDITQQEIPKRLTHSSKVDPELETETSKVISILIRQSFLYDTGSYSELDDYLNLLGRKGILSQEELINAISTDNIIETLESIIRKQLIYTGKIQNTSTVEMFYNLSSSNTQSRKETAKSTNTQVKALAHSISNDVITTLKNPKGVMNIIQAFTFDSNDLFDFEGLMRNLKQDGIINSKQEGYFRTMSTQVDVAHYLKHILEQNENFWNFLPEEHSRKLEQCFYTFDLMYGELYSINSAHKNITGEMINSMMDKLISDILSQGELAHDFLNIFINILKEHVGYTPIYMKLRHIDFDELIDISSAFHKALHILGIIFVDIIDKNSPYFEEISEILLVNFRSEKNRIEIMKVYQEKINN